MILPPARPRDSSALPAVVPVWRRSGAGGCRSLRRWCRGRRAPRSGAGGCGRCLAFEGDTATLWVPVMRVGEIVMEPGPPIVLSSDTATAAGRAAIDSLAGTSGASSAPRVAIALPGRQTLRRTLTLPAALEENLKQALAYDLDRHTPFKADELYFDAAIIGRDPARGEIRVDLAAARRGVVDHALQAVEGWGGQVVAVVPDVPAAASASRLNLLPEDRRPAAGSWRRWQVLAPIALLAAIALVGLTLPILQKREYAIALGRQVDTARAQAAVSEGVRTELERLTGEYNFALERKYAFPPTVQVLDEITKLLPDDTWLTQMELKTSSRGKEAQRELMLRGESGNAGRLITLFEESKVFAQAAPAVADNEDPAGSGRDLRPRRAASLAASRPHRSRLPRQRRNPLSAQPAPRRRPPTPPCRRSSPSPKAPPPLRAASRDAAPVTPSAPAPQSAPRRRLRPATRRREAMTPAVHRQADPRPIALARDRPARARRRPGALGDPRARAAAAPALRRSNRRVDRSPDAFPSCRRTGARARQGARSGARAQRPAILPQEHRAEPRQRRALRAREGGDRGQRRSHHHLAERPAERRRPDEAGRRQRAILRDDRQPAESAGSAGNPAALCHRREHHRAPGERVPRLQAAARTGSGADRAARRSRLGVPRSRAPAGDEPEGGHARRPRAKRR